MFKSILFRKITIFTLITLLIAIKNVQSTETILKKSSNIILNGNTLYAGGNGPGNYSNIHIKAKLKNTKDLESEWDEKEINIPSNKTINN